MESSTTSAICCGIDCIFNLRGLYAARRRQPDGCEYLGAAVEKYQTWSSLGKITTRFPALLQYQAAQIGFGA
jgi:hypothetical protein